jgi:hypothetical protein
LGRVGQKGDAADAAWDLYRQRLSALDHVVTGDEFFNGTRAALTGGIPQNLSAFAFTVAAPIARWLGAYRKGKRRDSRWKARAIAEQTTRIRVYLPPYVAPYGWWHSRSRQNRTGLLTSRGFKPPIEP